MTDPTQQSVKSKNPSKSVIQTKNTTFPKYPGYKDSGVEWLGEIPVGWKVRRLKVEINLLTGFPFQSSKYSNEGIKLARGINVKEGRFDWDDVRHWSELTKELERFLLQEGDVLIGMDGSKVGKNFCKVNMDDLPVLLLQRVARLRAKKFLNQNYLYWSIANHSFLSWVNMSKTDPMVPHIAPKDINGYVITLPPLPEQTAIANFLDEKTAKIDQAIAQKEKMIELLKERKQIIIQNAVTKGLDPNVKMKDSGVEWIVKIPVHWEVKKLKYEIKKAFSGGTPSTDKIDYWNGGIPWISSVDIKKDYISNTNREISEKGLKVSSSSIAPKGSVVFVTRSGILQHTFALSILQKDMAINQDIKCIILSDRLFEPYFLRLIQGNNTEVLVETRQQAATVESINMDLFFNLSIPIPPYDEQISIVSHIQSQATKIDKAITLQKTQIKKLKEYKTTLIDSAVTGKIRVNG